MNFKKKGKPKAENESEGKQPRWVMISFHFLAFSFFLFPFALTGCGRHGKAAPSGGSDVPPSKVNLKRSVELGQAVQQPLVYYVDNVVGVIEAERQTDLAAGVTGIVDEVLFREGDLVDTDTTLIKIDQQRYVAAAEVAAANLLRAENNEKLAAANIVRAENNKNLSEDQYERAMRSREASSLEEKTKFRLGRSMMEAELQSVKASLDVARAERRSAEASYKLAKNNLDRSRVRPPYPGRINQRKVTAGCYLEEKTVIATIADLSRLRLFGYVPEIAAPVVRELMAQQEQRTRAVRTVLPLSGWLAGSVPWATVAGLVLLQKNDVPSGYDPEFTLMAYPQQTFRGRIFYMSTVAYPDTHMFEFKAEVDTRGLKVELRPGYTAHIRIPLRSDPDAVVVPEESVRASERGFIAFVPVPRKGADGKTEYFAKARTLDLGYRSPGWVEVRKGIARGEWIVRRGAEALEDGTPIRFPEDQLHQLETGY